MRLYLATDDEIAEIQDLDKREFPGAAWPEGSTFWTLEHDPELGYCGARLAPARTVAGDWTGLPCVHLTRGWVCPDLHGRGIQARMIRRRLAWGRAHGATVAQTYTWHDNVPSMRNLARAGFVPLRAHQGYIRWERSL